MRYLVLLLPLLSACSRGDASKTKVEGTASAPIVEAIPVDAGPTIVTKVVSAAHFSGDKLFECVDIELTAPENVDLSGAPSLFDEMKKGEDGKGLVNIGSRCSSAFADRQVLASCRVDGLRGKDAGPDRAFYVTSSFYDYVDVFESDARMKECLEMSAEWSAISRESPSFQKAKREFSRARLEKMSKELQKAAE